MILIDELIQELKDISIEYNSGELSIEERNLKLDLLIRQLELVQLNFNYNPLQALDEDIQYVFINLLKKHKNKATVNITSLKQADDKRKYNRIARVLIERKLHFPSLYRTMKRNITGYADRNGLYHVEEFQIFILRGDDRDESR